MNNYLLSTRRKKGNFFSIVRRKETKFAKPKNMRIVDIFQSQYAHFNLLSYVIHARKCSQKLLMSSWERKS